MGSSHQALSSSAMGGRLGIMARFSTDHEAVRAALTSAGEELAGSESIPAKGSPILTGFFAAARIA
jgi:hypothetical protein